MSGWLAAPREWLGALGEIMHYRGAVFSMYGADPDGRLSWRYLVDQGGHGVSSDLLSHTIDLATYLVGPVESVVATTALFVPERPLPAEGELDTDDEDAESGSPSPS
jgi:predicted dehydrogenase